MDDMRRYFSLNGVYFSYGAILDVKRMRSSFEAKGQAGIRN
jgi:hypothetical protein